MEMRRFEELTRALAAGASRRSVLRGLVAGGGMVLIGATATTAKPGKGKGKANGRNRVGLCHRSEDGTFEYKKLPAKAAAAHNRSHGDQLCPTDDQCNVYESCSAEGACVPTAQIGEECSVPNDGGTTSAGLCAADAVTGVGFCDVPEAPETPIEG